MTDSQFPTGEAGEMLDRINVNTLRLIDRYMQDAAEGRAEIQTPVLRATIDLLKANRDIIRERQTEAERNVDIERRIAELPDFS